MEYVDALATLVGIAALLIFIYGPWQEICIDWARNRMFEARDAVFDIALAGRIELTSTEYTEIRDGFNSLIRFAHMISWPTILCINVMAADGIEKPAAKLALERISDVTTREEVRHQFNDASKAALLLLLLRSPFLWFVLLVGLAIRLITRSLDRIAFSLADRIQRDAEQYEGTEQSRFRPRPTAAQ